MFLKNIIINDKDFFNKKSEKGVETSDFQQYI